MESITKFKAKDGKEFTSDSDCIEYEKLIEGLNLIMVKLPHRPSDCEFVNGGGYLQHDEIQLQKTKAEFMDFCREYLNNIFKSQVIDDNTNFNLLGRFLDDCNLRLMYSAWMRFVCIDENLREWGQLYYANNTGEAKNVKLN